MQREFEFPVSHDVLYIEDHPTNVHLMKAIFKRRPQLQLVVARDGAQARQLATQLQPSLLLVDLRLPDCHGADLLEELRATVGWADLPAVAVTAEMGFETEGTSFAEVWPKPLDLALVLDRLDQLLSSVPPLMATGPSPAALQHE